MNILRQVTVQAQPYPGSIREVWESILFKKAERTIWNKDEIINVLNINIWGKKTFKKINKLENVALGTNWNA